MKIKTILTQSLLVAAMVVLSLNVSHAQEGGGEGGFFNAISAPSAGHAGNSLGGGDTSFLDFINTTVDSGTTTTSSTTDDFESFINSSTTTGTTNTGTSAPLTPLTTDVFSSTQTNVGGSIYVPYDGPVFSGPGLEGGALLAESLLDENVSKERDVKELVIGWTNFILSLTALIAVVALVWAGFLYVTAAGDDGRMETAKKIVIWVVVGILLILAAYAIVNTVMQAAF